MRFLPLLLIVLCASGCWSAPPQEDNAVKYVTVKEPLNRVNIVDHSGLSETITNAERLKELAQRNYLNPQPYRKVARVYARDKEGSARSIITSYYENGQVYQYLECINGRACGLYQEWHPNGQTKLLAHVLAGQADIDVKAFPTWSFDGLCQAWDEQGALTATFTYERGTLNGPSETFYPTGEKESTIQYENGSKEGQEITYGKDGTVLQTISYHEGLRHGPARGNFEDGSENWREEYDEDRLMNATYFNRKKESVSSVCQGEGLRSVFDDDYLESQEEVHGGRPEGKVTIYELNGAIERIYEVKNGKKHGTEVRYYTEKKSPRISIDWRDGMIHGTVKTWYQSGVLESQREMCQNARQGVSMAWYPDGALMLVEEYDNDKLVRGRYHRKGETTPVTTIENGSGVATLFDATGNVIDRVTYVDGKPQLPE